jgi:hypothetical protein
VRTWRCPFCRLVYLAPWRKTAWQFLLPAERKRERESLVWLRLAYSLCHSS